MQKISKRGIDFRHSFLAIAQGRLKTGVQGSATMGAPSRSQLSLNEIIIRIISTVKCYFRLSTPNKWEFRTTCQLATCDDRRPCIGLRLSPYIIITHSVKRRQSVEPVCAIVSHAHLFVSG
ncbi:hypothetical protein TNCV_1362571 [Trichonephila clavipes]|nr:hypothetical protein TNCV_1362571 [Trichonephila clavipes]